MLRADERDTQEKINEDADNTAESYWGCVHVCCSGCPCKIDGKSPYERYGASNCAHAMNLDLLRRQRELDARGEDAAMRKPAIEGSLPDELEGLFDELEACLPQEYWGCSEECNGCAAKKAYGKRDCRESMKCDVLARAHGLGRKSAVGAL